MGLQMNCQTTSKNIKTVQFVKVNGDTLIQMSLDDAKIVLNGLMRSEISDSLIKAYEIKDSISMNTIKLQDIENTLLKAKSSNQEKIIENYAKIIENKDDELNISKYIVQQQKKEIRKQKIIKKISLVGNVVLPVVTLFTIIGLK